MCQEIDMSWFHTNHLNNPQGDKDHSNGAQVRPGQLTGSKAQWRFSHLIMGLERDQQAEDETVRNTTTLRYVKDRLDGSPPPDTLIYDKGTGTMVEPSINMGGLV